MEKLWVLSFPGVGGDGSSNRFRFAATPILARDQKL
jgi:hypothetical protein